MKDKINPYRHRVKAIKSEWGVDYIITNGLGDPREARKRKTPVYGPGEHPREKRLKMLEAKAKKRKA
jgi:hypothetical protein